MRTTRRNSPKRGGKYKGEGVYGCGFSPPLKCKGEPTRRNASKLSKMLVVREEAEKEFDESRRIVKLDPERQYFITADGFCEHDQTNIRPENQTEKCKKFPLKAPSFLIFYEMGGDNLAEIKLPANKYWDFIRSFAGLLQGLEILHAGNVVHLDIKPPNIVSKLTPRGTSYITRYIDFGISQSTIGLTPYSETMWSTAVHELNTFYPYYPMDVLLASAQMKSMLNALKTTQFIANWYNYYRRYGNSILPADLLFNPNMTPAITSSDLLHAFDPGFYGDSTAVAKSVDVYSLCVALCEVYVRITGQALGINPDGSTDIFFKGGMYSLDELPELGLNDESVAFHRNLAEFSKQFFDVMKLGLDYRGKNRKTAQEIKEAFQKLVINSENPFADGDTAYLALVHVAPVLAPMKTAEVLKHQEGKRKLIEFRPENLPKQTANAVPTVPVAAAPLLTLPKGWVEMKSNEGETYYENPDLGHTQWSKPVEGWIEQINNNSGQSYWQNLKTGKTRWNHPRIPPKTIKKPQQGQIVANPLRNAIQKGKTKRLTRIHRNPLANLIQPSELPKIKTNKIQGNNRAGRFGLNPAFGF